MWESYTKLREEVRGPRESGSDRGLGNNGLNSNHPSIVAKGAVVAGETRATKSIAGLNNERGGKRGVGAEADHEVLAPNTRVVANRSEDVEGVGTLGVASNITNHVAKTRMRERTQICQGGYAKAILVVTKQFTANLVISADSGDMR